MAWRVPPRELFRRAPSALPSAGRSAGPPEATGARGRRPRALVVFSSRRFVRFQPVGARRPRVTAASRARGLTSRKLPNTPRPALRGRPGSHVEWAQPWTNADIYLQGGRSWERSSAVEERTAMRRQFGVQVGSGAGGPRAPRRGRPRHSASSSRRRRRRRPSRPRLT